MTTCTKCNDTGEVGQYGILDCSACNAAEDRAALNAYVKSLGPITEYDLVWHVHQRALKLAQEASAASIAQQGIEAARTFDEGTRRWPGPQAPSLPAGKFEHFASEEQRQRHLQQVAEAQKNGSPF